MLIEVLNMKKLNLLYKFFNEFLGVYDLNTNKVTEKTEQVHLAVRRFLDHNRDAYNIRDMYTSKYIIDEMGGNGIVYVRIKGKSINNEYNISLFDLDLKSTCDNSTEVQIIVRILKDGDLELQFAHTAPNSKDVAYCLNHLETFVYSLKTL